MSEGWGGPTVRGSGGGGGLNRELCRTFGHYNRHLTRLQHNLRETKKFFRDIKYSQGPTVFPVANAGPVGEEPPEQHPAPSAVDSAPAGGGASLHTGKCEGRNSRRRGRKTRIQAPLLGRGGVHFPAPHQAGRLEDKPGTPVYGAKGWHESTLDNSVLHEACPPPPERRACYGCTNDSCVRASDPRAELLVLVRGLNFTVGSVILNK
ncbi:hypothetical protein E2320_009963, partial [Naja naja]